MNLYHLFQQTTSHICIYKKMRSIALNNEEQFNGGQYVFAKTVFSFTESQSEEEVTTVFTDPLCRPALIDHFAIHNFSVNGSSYTHCFAVASWPQKHPDIILFGKPYHVWCKSLFESSLSNFLVPIENICYALLTADCTVKEENVLLIVIILILLNFHNFITFYICLYT